MNKLAKALGFILASYAIVTSAPVIMFLTPIFVGVALSKKLAKMIVD